ncbi:hypothetical protein C453_17224 [Haloferax elongans ATCC BAA-1513]|uniref:Uncharacterized protein n=1 Tax=Haloferax elongans ATCC BAA-1513 TaxID=1230453 RepID=M0HFB3_HALEO|nr:hypothetical protein [Haloferax elongans]ELZ81779.1 hypothetical protein C453_17224 [Haloferax elongans ATCC BAA-1513]
MTLNTQRVVLFEDRPERSEKFQEAWEEETVGEDLNIEGFDPGPEFETFDVIEPLREELGDTESPLLVILDEDLTEDTDHGVRQQDVREVCDEKNIPLCIYHRERTSEDETKRRIEEYEEDVVKLDPSRDYERLAADAANIARAFREIRTKYLSLKGAEQQHPIAEILCADEAVRSQMDQYKWGNPRTIVGQIDGMSEAEKDRQFTTLLGYWIYNELLEFPGGLLNPVATAAYLNVDYEAFEDDKQYQEPFSDALYEGPFSEMGQWWWKPQIDQIRANHMTAEDSGIPDGPELFKRLDCDPINTSKCHDEEMGGDHEARYYGVMIQKPVCKEHSKDGGGWLPMGATRSRISVAKHAEYNPWMQ